ncbi:MAG: hypothetical protein CSA11_02505 [Chloroflexi bacterium]|nr:MAG: hypothetical protein CSB13_04530 [Chloroflexota bacterium]PIE82004.1 MAG: hypothetical protein CSA11_02505 [Chloroflexota bacterium]
MCDLKGKRIFIVEDNVTNLAVFATTLRNYGAIIIQDAWNTGTVNMLCQNLPIDLVIIDIMLRKGITGYDIFNTMQEHEELKHIPVLAVSSLDPETEIPKAQAIGMVGFIGKPISIRHFPDQVSACIRKETVWEAGR